MVCVYACINVAQLNNLIENSLQIFPWGTVASGATEKTKWCLPAVNFQLYIRLFPVVKFNISPFKKTMLQLMQTITMLIRSSRQHKHTLVKTFLLQNQLGNWQLMKNHTNFDLLLKLFICYDPWMNGFVVIFFFPGSAYAHTKSLHQKNERKNLLMLKIYLCSSILC